MEQTILFCVLALALCQTVFLLNHRYLLRGAIFSAATGVGCLAALSFLFPAAGLCLIRYGCQRCLWNAGLQFFFC